MPVVGRIVVHAIALLHEAIHEQAPEVIVFTKIYRAIHRLHPSFLKPFAGSVKNKCSRNFVVGTFEKTHAAGGLFVGICFFVINKSRSPGNVGSL